METDLRLYGNELNYFTTFFNIGYMIMLYPSCIIISHVGPSIWLPACEIMWGIFTCCLSTATSAKQVYGLRFLIGFFEGATWPGYFTIIRGGLSTNLDGTLGRSGWRWAFIINGVCTIFIALIAFVLLPGFPDRPNPLARLYLRPCDIELAKQRINRIGRDPQIGITLKTFLRCFKFWHVWVFSIAWALGTGTTPTSYFNLWLNSVAMLNYLPIAGQAIQLVAEILFSGFSDYFGTRLPFLLVHSVINITALSILAARPDNVSFYMAGWYMDYIGAVSTMLLCAWAAAHLEKEPQVRTVLFATGTLFSYLFSAFLPIAAYPSSEAPNWQIGAKLYLGLSAVAAVLFISIASIFRWQAKREKRQGE
ncbi:hypothetical protein N7494_012866 [Penicillium frequentans]|uniref:Major facilitator superfamily (MFS) profile domain-containing protein n=1 Tax=Penicillium frequentans TaxID=3151616 RepID=A0AAD6CMW9_9EURO|nr:hypothetical protein N7494_012866 [Penicillium glabrum]